MGPGSIPKIGDKWAREKRGDRAAGGKKAEYFAPKTGGPGRRRGEA